jgi:hypothetical protein
MRYYATNRKVEGSIRNEIIGFLNWHNSISRTMAPGSTRPLTEMDFRNLPWGKGRQARKDGNLTAICEPIVYKMRRPDVSQPNGPHTCIHFSS